MPEKGVISTAQYALTTIDNPYDPFTQFEQWYRFDEDKGYHSCAYLARIARTSDQLSPAENANEIKRAIDDIIKYDFQGIYKRVVSNDPPEILVSGEDMGQ